MSNTETSNATEAAYRTFARAVGEQLEPNRKYDERVQKCLDGIADTIATRQQTEAKAAVEAAGERAKAAATRAAYAEHPAQWSEPPAETALRDLAKSL